MLKNTIIFIAFSSLLVSCQKSEVLNPDPVPEPSKTYLLKVENKSTQVNPATYDLFKTVDSLYYNAQNEMVGVRFESYNNGKVQTSFRYTFRKQGNEYIVTSDDGQGEWKAIIDPALGKTVYYGHARDYVYHSGGPDSIVVPYAEVSMEYEATGFLKKEQGRAINIIINADTRAIFRVGDLTTYANDGKNITQKIVTINNVDSTFSKRNGSLIISHKTFERHTYKYTHTTDAVPYFPLAPYPLAKQSLNLFATETMTVEVSNDNGQTWQPAPGRTVVKTFEYEVKDDLLQKTTTKVPGQLDKITTYFYFKK
jgi:hypothetical protein